MSQRIKLHDRIEVEYNEVPADYEWWYNFTLLLGGDKVWRQGIKSNRRIGTKELESIIITACGEFLSSCGNYLIRLNRKRVSKQQH